MPSENGFVNNGQATIDTYNDVAGNQHNTFIQSRDATDILKPSVVTEAAWDSHARYPAAECFKGTRTQVIDDILDWISSPKGQGKLFWLTGATGLGRSSIAHTLAERCKGRDILGGSFFFSANDIKRNDAGKLFSTLAYQLCCTSKSLNNRVTKVIRNDPSIVDKTPSDQYELLIKRIVSSNFSRPVIILDDLNEAGSDEVLQGILPVLQRASQSALRFIVTSQITPAIQNFLQEHSKQIDTLDLNSHEVEVDRDIRHFYVSKFSHLSKSRRLGDWYTDQDIDRLVVISGGLFLFAAVVVKYIGEGRSRNPRARLDDVLNVDIHAMPEVRDRLDALYRQILSQIPQDVYKVTQGLMATVCLAASPLTASDLDSLHGLESGDSWRYFQDLHAFFHVPSEDKTKSPVRLVHGFFRSFIFDPKRSQEYSIDSDPHHGYLATRCLDTLSNGLHRNLCDLPPTGSRWQAQMDSLIKQRSSLFITGAVEYSLRFWYYHLGFVRSQPPRETLTSLRHFVLRSILHWLEAMSILGRLGEAIHIMRESSPSIETLTETSIAERFQVVMEATQSQLTHLIEWPLRIYGAGLPESVEDDPVAPPVVEEFREERPMSPQLASEAQQSSVGQPLPPIMSEPGYELEPLPEPLAPQVELLLAPQSPSPLVRQEDINKRSRPKEIHNPDMVVPRAKLPPTMGTPPPRLLLPPLRIAQKQGTHVASSSPSAKASNPTLPVRNLEIPLSEHERPSVWHIDHVASRSFRFPCAWPSTAKSQTHIDVLIPEIQGASYEDDVQVASPCYGWTCSKCGQLAGELVFFSVSDGAQAIVCESCLIREVPLRSQTYIIFSWVNRYQENDPKCVPTLRPFEPTCDDCQEIIGDRGAYFHCILCRHIKSGEICSSCFNKRSQRVSRPCLFVRCVSPFIPVTPPSKIPVSTRYVRPLARREWSNNSYDSPTPPSSHLRTPVSEFPFSDIAVKSPVSSIYSPVHRRLRPPYLQESMRSVTGTNLKLNQEFSIPPTPPSRSFAMRTPPPDHPTKRATRAHLTRLNTSPMPPGRQLP